MKAALAVLLLETCLVAALAEEGPPALMWEREYYPETGTGFKCVVEAENGCFALAGQSGPSGTQRKIAFLTSASGDIIWTYAAELFDQFGWWIEQTSDGGFVITGFGKIEYDDSYSAFLVKLDPSGEEQWLRLYDGSAGVDAGSCVSELPDGGFAVCGYIDSYDSWLLRTDSQGDTLWTRVWDGGSASRARTVLYHDGGLTVFAAGGTPGPWILRYDLSGNLQWVVDYTGEFPTGDWGGAMCFAQEPGYAFASAADSWLVRTDWSGGEEWRQEIEGYWGRLGLSLSPTMDGGYIFSGWEGYQGSPVDYCRDQDESLAYAGTNWDGWLVKLDQLGQIQWHISNGGGGRDNSFNSVRQLQGGGYIVAGQILDSSWRGYLLRYAPETGIESDPDMPEQGLSLSLSCNPFSSSVTITCEGPSLPGQLMVYDITGRLIRSLSNSQGSSFLWDGRDESGADVPVGTYLIQGAVDGQISSIRLIRL